MPPDQTADRGDDFVATEDDDGKKPEAKKPEPEAKDEPKKEPEAKKEPEVVDEDDESEGEEAAEAAKRSKKDTRIPLSRHKELLEKERAERAELEKRLKHYEHADKVADAHAELTAQEKKLVELEKQLAKLNADGETERAAEKMREIRQLDREIIKAENDAQVAAAIAIATENARYNIALERVEEAYPQLNPDHESYDKELMTDVADLKITYQRRGMTATEALQKAVKRLVPQETKKQEAAAEVKPKVDAEAVEKEVKKDLAAERKKGAVEKALDAAKKTPPATTDVGADSDKAGGTISAKDVIKMSQKDFAALPEEMLKKMRGDEL